ncbi:MFS transporter AraJ [Apibacter raozihei]|uniref:MFS transporter AraJ n=1 Tax=Apibacter raozihei TaxID=2500547 RepID=UPI000FE3FB42|nr:MFS transporter AraJ [Apibacter raozihei]
MRKSTVALALGTLGLGMSEFGMMGILPDIAKDLSISIPQAGHFISAYALGVAVGAPLLVLAGRKLPLKKVLLGLILIYMVGNLCFSFFSSYKINLFFRFISGLPHGAYFGVGSIVAQRLAKEGKGTSAVAGMISGMTVANLVGVPLGTFISHNFSWSVTYLIIGALGFFIFYTIIKYIPDLEPLPDVGFKKQFHFLKKLNPWIILFTTILGNGGIFCWYSYINPIMTQSVGFSSESMTGVMMFAGLGMVVGNLVSGKLSDQYSPEKVGTVTQGLAMLTLVLFFLLVHSQAASLVLMFVGTACLFAVSAPQQILLLQNSKGGEMLGAALVQVAFNIGNALGAYSGGVFIYKNYPYEYSVLPGIVLTSVGFILFIIYLNKNKTR